MSSRAKKKIRRPQAPVSQDRVDATRMTRHGITPQDLDRVGKQAFDEGFKASTDMLMKSCYGAAVLAYKRECEERGVPYDVQRGVAFLVRMDEIITYSLTSAEIVDRALEEAGVSVNFAEAFTEDRIQEKEE